MENQSTKSNCPKFVIGGSIAVVAAILFAPIVYDEYKYHKCIGLINTLTVEMKELTGEKKGSDYFQKMMTLQCYGSAFRDK